MKVKYLNFYIYIIKFLEIIAIQEVLSRGLVDTWGLKLFPQVLSYGRSFDDRPLHSSCIKKQSWFKKSK